MTGISIFLSNKPLTTLSPNPATTTYSACTSILRSYPPFPTEVKSND
ncbi:hypothetical protein BN341_12410 [Helicobacter heilmannii ASB1.4]|nr:hypothetical protein BN341_12410 [Helicobacter heilmannii ASB1.4]